MFTDSADFSNITNDPMFIGQMIQKTRLELDQNGTRAAAVMMGLLMGCARPKPPKKIYSVKLDRPFAFLIYDPEEKQMLFIGKVNDPTL